MLTVDNHWHTRQFRSDKPKYVRFEITGMHHVDTLFAHQGRQSTNYPPTVTAIMTEFRGRHRR